MKVVNAKWMPWALLAVLEGCAQGAIERTDVTTEGPSTAEMPTSASPAGNGAAPGDSSSSNGGAAPLISPFPDDAETPLDETAMPSEAVTPPDTAMPPEMAMPTETEPPTDDAAMPVDDGTMPTETADCTPQDPGELSDFCNSPYGDICEARGSLSDALALSIEECRGVGVNVFALSAVHFTSCDVLELRSTDGFNSITTRYDASGEELVGVSTGTDAIVCPPPVMRWGDTTTCDAEGCMVCGGTTRVPSCDAATVPEAARICREQETSLSPECTACACDACLPFALLTRSGANPVVPHFDTCFAEQCAACSAADAGP